MKLPILCFLLCMVTIFAEEEYAQLLQEATAAENAGNADLALDRWAATQKAAGTPLLRLEAVTARYRILAGQGKKSDAAKVLADALEKEEFSELEQRILLNMLAHELFRSPRYEYALFLLNRAGRLSIPPSRNEYYQTFDLKAHIWYSRKENPEVAYQIITEMTDCVDTHPANRFSANFFAGNLCEKMGLNEMALRHYRQALEHGRKVTYKFNWQAAEKAIERMTEKIKETPK